MGENFDDLAKGPLAQSGFKIMHRSKDGRAVVVRVEGANARINSTPAAWEPVKGGERRTTYRMRWPRSLPCQLILGFAILIRIACTTAMAGQLEFERSHALSTPFPVFHMAVNPAGDLVAATASTFKFPLYIWDLKNKRLRNKLEVVNTDGLLAFTMDGRYLIADPAEQQKGRPGVIASVFDLFSDQWVAHLTVDKPYARASIAQASPNGNQVAVVWDDERNVTIFSTNSWDKEVSWRAFPRKFYNSIRYDADGRTVVLGRFDGHIEIRDAQSGAHLSDIQTHIEAVRSALFAGRNRVITFSNSALMFANGKEAYPIKVWDITKPEAPSLAIAQDDINVRSTAISGNKLFVVASYPNIIVFDINSMNIISKIQIPDAFSVSPAGDCICVGRSQSIEIWCPKQGN